MKTIIYTLFAFSLFFTNTLNAQADVPKIRQEQRNWCWAANTRCIANYYGKKADEKQCDIVNWAYEDKKRCCQNGRSCDQMNSMKAGQMGGQGPGLGMLEICRDYAGLQAEHYNGPMKKDKLEAAHEEQRPFIVGCMWGQQGGHVIVGHGYEDGYVSVMDPSGGTKYTFKYGTRIIIGGQTGTWKEGIEVTEPFLGTKDIAFKSGIKVYPTLITSTFTVKLKEINNTSLSIYNTLGKKVLSKNLTSTNSTLNISNLAEGVYFAKISNASNREATFKIVKQ